jgi:hypothetical protein
MFLNPNMAVRLGFNFGMHSDESTELAPPPTPPATQGPNQVTKNSYFMFGLIPGIEMHMGDMPKLSPYVGAEVGFNTKSSKTEITGYEFMDNSSVATKNIWEDGSNAGYTEISFNVLLGADYYISKHLYCGAEVGVGLVNTSYKDQEFTSTQSNISTTLKTPGGKSMNMGVNFVPAIRLGWAIN